MLTTIDNPYNPFEDFDKWYVWDEINSVNRTSCCRLLGASCATSGSLTEKENDDEIERAILEIVKRDPAHIYVAIEPGTKTPVKPIDDSSDENDADGEEKSEKSKKSEKN